MSQMEEIRRADSPSADNKDDAIIKNQDLEPELAEYHEFLALDQEYQGAALKKLTRKIDFRVVIQLQIIYLLSNIDRSNVGNARLFGVESDLKMAGTDWNIGLCIFFITYALAGPPSNICLKLFGPRKVLPTLLVCVSFVLIGTGVCNNRASWFALRLLLGVFEAGMFPGCAYTLTTWYTPFQIHTRIGFFYFGSALAGAFSGLLAFAIGQLDGTWGYRGWRFIYIIEGLISLIFGLFAYWWIQETPSKQTGWLTTKEARYLVLRNRYQYGTDSSGNKDDFSWYAVWAALKSPHTQTVCFIYFSGCVGLYGFQFTVPTLMKNMGFTAANAQLVSAPPYIFALFCIVASGWYSDKYRKRAFSLVIPSSVAFIGTLICLTTVKSKNLIGLTYVGVCFAAGGFWCLSPACTSWASLNNAGQTKRNGAIAITTVWAQFGGLVGSNIFLAQEAPGYPTGFGCAIAFIVVGCIITPLVYRYACMRINRKRDAMSEEEIRAKYTPEELQAMGDLSPFYRYEY